MKKLKLLALVSILLAIAFPAFGGEIHRAIQAGDVDLVKQILKNNPDAVFQRDDSQFRDLPIHVAAATGSIEITRLLLDAGADIDGGDSDNSTALGVAAMRRNGELVKFLKEHNYQVLKPHLNTGSKLFYNALSAEVS